MQWSLYSYTAHLSWLCIVNSTWPTPLSNKVISKCDSANHWSPKHVSNMWWYYLVLCHCFLASKIPQKNHPEISIAEYTLRVIIVNIAHVCCTGTCNMTYSRSLFAQAISGFSLLIDFWHFSYWFVFFLSCWGEEDKKALSRCGFTFEYSAQRAELCFYVGGSHFITFSLAF